MAENTETKVDETAKTDEVTAETTDTTTKTERTDKKDIDPKDGAKKSETAATEEAKPEGTLYTADQLAELKTTWEQEQLQKQEDEKDFDKMTPEEKAQKLLADQQAENTKLQAQLLDRDLTDYAREQIAKEELPAGSLDFVKGTDKEDTNKRISDFKALLATGVQTGVETRFKQNGYTPRGTASGVNSGESGTQTRSEALYDALYNSEGDK